MKRLVELVTLAVIAVLVMGGAVSMRTSGSSAVAKTNRPDKEEVRYALGNAPETQDSCVSFSRFDLLMHRPSAC
jgi:hypothetical protein